MSDTGILVLLSTGWGVRTFLQTDVLPDLEANGARVSILAAPTLVAELRRRHPGLRIEPLDELDPGAGRAGSLYRRRQAHFRRLASTVTRRHNRRRQLAGARPRSRLRAHLEDLEAALRASPRSVVELARRQEEAFLEEYPGRSRLERLLAELAPTLVVSTVPHVVSEAPPVLVARRLGMRTAAWINSWDNLTSKGAYPATFDHYFVWSETMVAEMRRYYPEVEGRPVEAIGVPHFDWYRQSAMVANREAFLADLGLDAGRPLVLYGAATPFLAPKEHLVVERLADDLASGASSDRPQLLVRLHPADGGDRFGSLEGRDDAVVDVPGHRDGGTNRYCPTAEENRRQVSSVVHADVVVNLASTLTLDAAVADRPAVNVAYGIDESPFQEAAIREYYRYDHYRTVLELEAARLAESPSDLVEEIGRALADPEAGREGRRRLVEHWCGRVDGQAGSRLAHRLVALADASTARPAHG